MTLEYVLLMSVFALTLGGVMIKGPKDSFNTSAPRLGARVEKAIITGDGFKYKGSRESWLKPVR